VKPKQVNASIVVKCVETNSLVADLKLFGKLLGWEKRFSIWTEHFV